MIYDQLLKFSSLFFIFADEFEDKLKKPVRKERYWDEEFLIQHDIIPIEMGNNTALLGNGSFSWVYSVIYKSKPAVAKVTKFNGDFRKMVALSSLKDKVPKEYQKHIPIIYDTMNGFDKNVKKYIIIMEELQPTNVHVDDFINTGFSKYLIKDKMLYLNNDLEHVLKSFFDETSLKIEIGDKKYEKIINDTIIFLQNENSKLLDAKNDLNFRELRRDIEDNLLLFLKQKHQININESKFISARYFKFLFDHFPVGDFPIESKTPEGFHGEAPETKSLFEFLIYLRDMLNIRWDDMRSPNIMERPGTRDLVISDPGQFYGL